MKKYIFIVLLFLHLANWACDCIHFDQKEAIKQSEWVFYGKVIAVKLYCAKDSNDFYTFKNEIDLDKFRDSLYKKDRVLFENFIQNYRHTFWLHEIQIIDKIKGAFTENKVFIYTQVESGTCAINYPVDEEIVILAQVNYNPDKVFFNQYKRKNIPLAYTHVCYDLIAKNLRKHNQWTADIDLFRPNPPLLTPIPLNPPKDNSQKIIK